MSANRLHRLVDLIKASSFRPYVLSIGCCGVEFDLLRSANYDWQRLGIFETNEPSEADVLILSGWLTEAVQKRALQVYSQLKTPKYVIAVGACAISGSPYNTGEKRPILAADFLPVNIYAPGCPPRPEVILEALIELKRQVNPERNQKEILQQAMKTGPAL